MRVIYHFASVFLIVISWLFLWAERVDSGFNGRFGNLAFTLLSVATVVCIFKAFKDHSDQKTRLAENENLNNRLISEGQQAESFYIGLLNSLVSHLVVINPEGEIVATNSAWDRFASENGGANLQCIGINSDYFAVCEKSAQGGDLIAADILAGIKSVTQGKQDLFCADYPCHSPEKQRWFRIRVAKFLNNDALTVISHDDITTRKLAELENEKMAFDLLQRNQNIEQFSYIVSHNLRAPVANILGFAELLKHSPHYLEFDDLRDGIYDAAYKTDEIVKDLNGVLQIGSQLFENKTVVLFNEIVESVSYGIESILKNRNITIRTDFSHAPGMLTVKSYLYSIFYNLIYNSVKYQSADRNGLIEISSAATEKGLRLIFKDNGIGIDLKKNGQKLFGLYRRFHINTEGKGMGLFIVKTQVETLGGNISAKSELNRGTEFILEFNSYD